MGRAPVSGVAHVSVARAINMQRISAAERPYLFIGLDLLQIF
jgi:hypothetical protein